MNINESVHTVRRIIILKYSGDGIKTLQEKTRQEVLSKKPIHKKSQ